MIVGAGVAGSAVQQVTVAIEQDSIYQSSITGGKLNYQSACPSICLSISG